MKTDAVTPLTDEQQRLVEEHVSLVHAIARGWRVRCRTTIEHADLVQAGSLGLIGAAKRWDASRGVPFAALAADRIRGAICDHFRSLDPLTRERRKAVRALETAATELRTTLGRDPRTEEVAGSLGWADAKVNDARGDSAALAAGWAQVRSLEAGDADTTPAMGDDPFTSLLGSEQRAMVVELLKELPERERVVLDLYYREELQLKEIGEVLGVTESRVCQIHGAAIKRLRAVVASRELVAA